MAYKKSNPNGQATMANSEPIVIASNQTAVPVSATDLDIRNLVNTDVVTAELSAVDNAVLDAIAASVAAIDTDTTTIIGHLDGVEGLLTTIDTDTGDIAVDADAIRVSVQLIDDTVTTLGTDTYTEAASKGITIGAVRRDADTTLVDTTNEFGPLQMDANGRLKVEAFSGETLPVSLTSTTVTGTVAVTQSGTWDEVGINDSGNSITVDNGGTFAVQVDGAALTALQLIDDPVATLGTTTYTEAATKGMIVGAVRRDANTTLVDTTNEVSPLQVNATGELKVAQIQSLPAGTNAIGKLAANTGVTIGAVEIAAAQTLTTVTTVGTVSALGVGTTGPQKAEDVASAGGDMGVLVMASRLDTPVANAGVSNDGDYTNPIVNNFRKLWITGTVPEDTAHVAGEAIMQGGVRRIDTAATSAGTSGDWATMDASAEGALRATLTPTTTSGLTTMNASSSDGSTALTSTAQVIKATAGNLYGYYIYNPNSTAQFVQFYNTAAASVTVGTTNPLFMLTIPATSAANLMFAYPVGFSNAGWSRAATSTAAGNGAPTTALDAVCWYK